MNILILNNLPLLRKKISHLLIILRRGRGYLFNVLVLLFLVIVKALNLCTYDEHQSCWFLIMSNKADLDYKLLVSFRRTLFFLVPLYDLLNQGVIH